METPEHCKPQQETSEDRLPSASAPYPAEPDKGSLRCPSVTNIRRINPLDSGNMTFPVAPPAGQILYFCPTRSKSLKKGRRSFTFSSTQLLFYGMHRALQPHGRAELETDQNPDLFSWNLEIIEKSGVILDFLGHEFILNYGLLHFNEGRTHLSIGTRLLEYPETQRGTAESDWPTSDLWPSLETFRCWYTTGIQLSHCG